MTSEKVRSIIGVVCNSRNVSFRDHLQEEIGFCYPYSCKDRDIRTVPRPGTGSSRGPTGSRKTL